MIYYCHLLQSWSTAHSSRVMSLLVFKTAVILLSTLPMDDLKNYRPVSGLSFILKLVERVVAKHWPQFHIKIG